VFGLKEASTMVDIGKKVLLVLLMRTQEFK